MSNGTAESKSTTLSGWKLKDNETQDNIMSDKYNTEAAEALANEALRLPISEAVPMYEQLLTTFPTAAKFWKQFVEAHMAVNNDEATRQVFSRCLLNCLQVPLWRCYIRFIRKVNDKRGIDGQEETKKAFDFMLNYVGADIASGPVWLEYIAYLKSLPAQRTLEESQRMTLIHKTYQRAIVLPTHHVEQLWRDYESFENSVSRALVELVSDFSVNGRLTTCDSFLCKSSDQKSATGNELFAALLGTLLVKKLTYHAKMIYSILNFFDHSDIHAKGLLSEYQPKYNSAKAVYRERKKYVDEIEWNMLAVPPSGSPKEEMQWMAWNKLLSFEKSNPQRIDNDSANKRIAFAFEQCLMYLYHYPDVWYEYAQWHAKSGSTDSAVKVFQRALKALPDSEMLKYAYAELRESHGAIQAAKKVYELLLGDGLNATALSHIQFIRFLRRTEGVEAARKYFLEARKSPNCSYHVYVAYAMMAFCLDKDSKVAHNIFEAGLKRFMHEPGYILEYADFLCRLNDDRNIRALFERALSSLPPDESVEVWKRFSQFEQMYGDLASMLKVEQRRKEALSRMGEDGESVLESSLQDVLSRYSFMDLWPCSAKDLDHLTRQEWLSKNINKKIENHIPPTGASSSDRSISGTPNVSNYFGKIVYPDTSRMVIYGPTQRPGTAAPVLPGVPSTLLGNTLSNGGALNPLNGSMKVLPPALLNFAANLPAVDGPSPDVDFVISICLQSNLTSATAVSVARPQLQVGSVPSTSNISGSNNYKQGGGLSGKRKDSERQEDDDASTTQSQPLPRDAFKIRQLQKARVTSSRGGGGSVSYGGSTSYGSGFSGDHSASSG